jgi:tRNA (guanine-N7-)-methyltransferase
VERLDPKDFVITRRRKRYKFALFHNSPLCFEAGEWKKTSTTDVLELGAGTGVFSTALAASNPQKQFVAMDVKADRLQTGARQSEAEDLKNIRFLRARGDLAEEYFAPRSLEAIWLTFPDPFAKERGAKRRLTHPHFLKRYQNLLKKNGALYLKTDARELFLWSLEQLVREGWRIDELSFDLHGSTLADEYKNPTTYESRYIAEGEKINIVRASP